MPASQHTIAGMVLTMPIKIRTADEHLAMFSVPAAAAQRLIDYSGLQVCQYRPGRAAVLLLLTRFVDGDLGRYHEFSTAVMVNPRGSTAQGMRAFADAATFIHHMPVDGEFTLQAGQRIWGYPKVMADFTVRDGTQFGFDVSIDGQLIAGMEFRRGLPAPATLMARGQVQRTYTHSNGIIRETPLESRMTGVRARLGGARLWLGDHPYAKELASLGLPRRPLASVSAANIEMTVGDAHELN